jgi:hypothetical protein
LRETCVSAFASQIPNGFPPTNDDQGDPYPLGLMRLSFNLIELQFNRKRATDGVGAERIPEARARFSGLTAMSPAASFVGAAPSMAHGPDRRRCNARLPDDGL